MTAILLTGMVSAQNRTATGVVTDAIGNHTNAWTDYFSCWATVSAGSSDENESAGHTVAAQKLDFTVRFCSETAVIDARHYRILLGDRIYNITGWDDMGFKHKSRKFHAELKER